MQTRIQETKRIHKYMYEGLDPTIYISLKHQSSLNLKREAFANNPQGIHYLANTIESLISIEKSPKDRKRDKKSNKSIKNELGIYLIII